MLHPFAGFLAECAMCCQILALRCLEQESRAVWQKAKDGDLRAARKQVSRIVGRDTERLSMEGVIRAAVETVAENTSDGVIAPMMFLLIGGAPLGFLYKAINTMDSMLGYKNDRYLYFGRAAARLDDAANFIPARITGLLMTLAAFITGLDGKNAWRIFLRDRGNHASPNAGQSESACAGALGIRLLGDASYFGQVVEKPTVGDDTRSPEPKDILRANRLLFASSCLCLLIGCCLFFLLEVIG
jgi:adenosylcobinamide-phosphate synthase